jgi:hypothetical protein
MFPNVRIMVVATLASIVAVICGMGVLAAIGINHEPFTRLPGDRPPLQIVFDHTVPAAKATTVFGVRFQVGAQPTADDEAAKSAPAPPADAPAKETVADAKSTLDAATPAATKPPASAVANTVRATPVHGRRIVRRVSTQFADQTVSRQSLQWSQPAAQTARPVTGAISRAVMNKTLTNSLAAELPTPPIP